MPQILASNFGLSINSTPALTAGEMPMFNPGDEVYYIPDVLSSAGATSAKVNRKWTVVSGGPLSFDQSGTQQNRDQLSATSVADGTTSRAIDGYSGVLGSRTYGATTISSPWFYNLRSNDGGTLVSIPECKIGTKAEHRVFVALSSTINLMIP